jgi:uncharacterized membrane protein
MRHEPSNRSSASERPPHWADALLRLLVRRDDVETVSGDLLEEYRETVRPALGGRRADIWYVAQVLGFIPPACWVLGGAQGAAMVIRNAFDWFVPTADFNARSMVTTLTAITLFLAAGLWVAWRSGSLRSGLLAGFVSSAAAAFVSIVGAACLLSFRHDQQTLLAITNSGGLGEVFELPVLLIVPATFVAAIGAAAGKLLRVSFVRLCT